jgi:hypothetical protein
MENFFKKMYQFFCSCFYWCKPPTPCSTNAASLSPVPPPPAPENTPSSSSKQTPDNSVPSSPVISPRTEIAQMCRTLEELYPEENHEVKTTIIYPFEEEGSWIKIKRENGVRVLPNTNNSIRTPSANHDIIKADQRIKRHKKLANYF